jgi:hypothetical protein
MQVTLKIRTTLGRKRPEQRVDLKVADAQDLQAQIDRHTRPLRESSDLEVGLSTAPEDVLNLLSMLAELYNTEHQDA